MQQYVLLAYGASFIATGFALGLQARAADSRSALPRVALLLATSFALAHGASDWLELSIYLEARGRGVFPGDLAVARLVLLAGSFALLAAFGLDLALRRRRFPLAALLPAAALCAWGVAAAVMLRTRSMDQGTFASAEAATRYLLGVPACAAALVGLDRARRRLEIEEWRTARYVGAAAVALAAYGFFTGLVVPQSTLPPSTVLNSSVFESAVHLPVEIFRAGSIGMVGLLLSEAFVHRTSERLRSEGNHLRDDFISLVAHDLRTPLGTIDSGAALLERLPTEQHGSEREKRLLRSIRSSARTTLKMVSDLLDASRIEARRLAVAPERFDVGGLLLRMLEWAPADAMRGHAVRLELPAPVNPVLADPVRVEQVLWNLLTNAGKYSFPGSEIVIGARGDRRAVTISVTNAGPGIPARDLERVFARSYRTRAAERGAAEGLGLGLYIAKGLVEAHGGRIWAESEPGNHTTFRFTLPVARESAAAAGDRRDGPPRGPADVARPPALPDGPPAHPE